MGQQSIDTLTQLCNKLNDLGQLSLGLATAIEQGDELEVLSFMHTGRIARASLARTKRELSSVEIEHTKATIELMAQARELMQLVALGEQVSETWLHRSLPDDEVMMQSEAGQMFLMDAMLPLTWDYQSDVVCFAGPGFGPLAQKLLGVHQKRIIAYVPDSDDSEYPAEVIRVSSLEEIERAAMTFNPHPPQRVATRQLPNSQLPEESHKEMSKHLHKGLTDLNIHRNTVDNFAQVWLEQGMSNLCTIASHPSIETIGHAFRGIPMVIVAPGPSLKKNIAELKRIQIQGQTGRRALILAFSHSLAPLTAEGIVPDFVLSVDPQDVRYHFESSDMSKVTAVLNGATVHPELYKLGTKHTVTLAANSAMEQWIYGAFGERANAAGGGSVATTALSIGLNWGCNPIVFCGLDLSYPNGQMYIDTSVDGDAKLIADENGNVTTTGWSGDCATMLNQANPTGGNVARGVELAGYYGGTVQSDFMFSLFHRWFEIVSDNAKEHTSVLNCTEGGAYIKGMEHRPLSAVVSELQGTVDSSAILRKVESDMGVAARQQAMLQWIDKLLKGINTCLSLAHRCVRLCDDALTPEGHQKLQTFEAKLMATIAPLKFVSMLAQPQIELALEHARDATTAQDTIDASKRIFQVSISACQWLLPKLRDARSELAVAMETSSLQRQQPTPG